jgi:Na+/H+ antiporter NhaD/arsenite permease-like protein
MGQPPIPVNPWMMLPFGLLLALIALGPVYWPHWWARRYGQVAFSLGVATLVYYLAGLHDAASVLRVGHDYVSFMVLIGSLFIVSGGIHLNIKGEATPRANVLFLLLGGILSNLLGTTGASMLLIRPWLRMNHYRVTAHHVVFFIFIVSNVGGGLTPIGDPPLFLGYLKGVPFWWVARSCWLMWAVAMGFLLTAFYFIDAANYRRAPRDVRSKLAETANPWRFEGLWNLAFLGVILAAVFIDHPLFLRETLMTAAALGSYFTTPKQVHLANHFEFHPLREVAVLFAGIFATMLPGLDWLQQNAGRLAGPTPGLFYWGSGVLSSFLDSAPAYLGFLNAAFGRFVNPGWGTGGLGNHGMAAAQAGVEQAKVAFLLAEPALRRYVLAISLGTVFFGANTYLGNGPNLMVKAIAEHQKVRTPGFLGMILKYTLPCMVPMLVLIWLLFLR